MRLARRAQIIAVAGLLCTALLLILGTGANHRTLLRQQLTSTMASHVAMEASLVRNRLDASEQLLRGLAGGPALQRYLDTDATEDLIDRFLVLAANHPQILQVRFLDTEGRERLRVDRLGDRVLTIAPQDLQDKSGRDYVTTGLSLPPGEVWLTRLEPNREHGVIQRPVQPTTRLLTSIFDSENRRRGLLVLNLNGHEILPRPMRGSMVLRIADQRGSYLLHPDPTRTFGPDQGTGSSTQRDFGLVPTSLSDPEGVLHLSDRSADRAEPLLAVYQWFDLDTYGTQRWLLLTSVPEGLLSALWRRDITVMAGSVILIAGMACLLIWLALKHVAERLEGITNAARLIAGGKRDVVVESTGDDEVAVLGQAFNGMTRELNQALTAEKRIRAQLEEANRELKRSNDDLESFARAAAHDLKTPLRALRILPSFIEDDIGVIEAPLSQHLHEMTTQAERLEDLVDGLLRYSVLGKEKSAPETFAPGPVIDRIARTCTIPRGFRLRQDIRVPTITCILVEFEITVRNLVQNALRHHDRDEGQITVRISAGDVTYRIEVQDDGPGVPDKLKDKVLLPLRTGKTKDQGAGTGLGLAFLSKIADRRGGSVMLIDAPGRGLIVRLTLPRPEATKSDAAATAPRAELRPSAPAVPYPVPPRIPPNTAPPPMG